MLKRISLDNKLTNLDINSERNLKNLVTMSVQTNMLQPLAIVFFFIFAYTAEALQCLDENGGSVDWIFVYKLPPSKSSDNALIKKGVAYVYLSSSTPTWTLSKIGIDDQASIVGKQMNAFLEKKDDRCYLAYNDKLENKEENKTAGHAKGIILADKDGGVWGVGSLTDYPGTEETYRYPEHGKAHGHLFSCLSIDLPMLDRIATPLAYRQPQIYSAHISPEMEKLLPNLASVIKGERSVSSPWFQDHVTRSRADLFVIMFSKSREYDGELYKDLVASKNKSNFLVRSAISKKDGLPSNCTKYKVENIQTVKLAGITITNDEDKAKWAVSDPKLEVMCYGDMDRNESEKHRGGGAVCIINEDLNKKFRELVASVEKCP